MAFPVYSQRILFIHGGGSNMFVVPNGERLIVRWISAFNSNALAGATFNVNDADTSCTLAQLDLGPQSQGQVELRQVIDEGGTLHASADSGVDVTISGYLLTLP